MCILWYLQFLAWLSEAESLCENAEQELDRNPLALKVSTKPTFPLEINSASVWIKIWQATLLGLSS